VDLEDSAFLFVVGGRNMINLEQLTARYAQGITECIENTQQAKDAERYITNSLGILQENGIYAAIVYVLSKTNGNNFESTCYIYILDRLMALLGDTNLHYLNLGLNPGITRETINTNRPRILQHVSDRIANAIDNVLITHRLFEQTLIFARYGAKALRGN